MTFRVELSRSAANYMRRLDRPTQTKIVALLEKIGHNPYDRHTKPLAGHPGRRSARVGAYRIVYSVNEALMTIEVSHIGPRGQVYGRL